MEIGNIAAGDPGVGEGNAVSPGIARPSKGISPVLWRIKINSSDADVHLASRHFPGALREL